jgi:hypothetical protein
MFVDVITDFGLGTVCDVDENEPISEAETSVLNWCRTQSTQQQLPLRCRCVLLASQTPKSAVTDCVIDRNTVTVASAAKSHRLVFVVSQSIATTPASSSTGAPASIADTGEVARLSKVIDTLNEVVASRGKTVADLRNKLKEHEKVAQQHEQMLRDTGRKVAQFWQERIARHNADLNQSLATFVSSSAQVLAGGDFPRGDASALRGSGERDDDDDENDDDDDDDDQLASPRVTSAPKLEPDKSDDDSNDSNTAAPAPTLISPGRTARTAAQITNAFQSIRATALKALSLPGNVTAVRQQVRNHCIG